jgi:hypothetical protein
MRIPELLLPYRELFEKLDLAHLALRESPADGPLPRLATKLGGRPDLPPGTPWPSGDGGEPAQFGLQINFTDLAARFPGLLPWPSGGGMLQFFIAYDEPRVVVHRDLDLLQPADGPVESLPEYALEPEPGAALGNDQPPSRQEEIDALQQRLNPDEHAAFQAWAYPDEPTYQLGGSTFWIQESYVWTAPLAEQGLNPFKESQGESAAEYYGRSERAYEQGWRFMLQFGSMDDDHEYMFGDCGVFYFVAPLDADGRWDLDRTQVIYQSH